MTRHNHILHTLTTCKTYQNNYVRSNAISWPSTHGRLENRLRAFKATS